MKTVEELRAALEDLEFTRATLQEEIDAYRAENPKGPGVEAAYLTDGDGIPNTMDYRRVTLDAQIDLARHALNEAIASSPVETPVDAPVDAPAVEESIDEDPPTDEE